MKDKCRWFYAEGYQRYTGEPECLSKTENRVRDYLDDDWKYCPFCGKEIEVKDAG